MNKILEHTVSARLIAASIIRICQKNQGAQVYSDQCIIKWRLRSPPKCAYYLMANFQRQYVENGISE